MWAMGDACVRGIVKAPATIDAVAVRDIQSRILVTPRCQHGLSCLVDAVLTNHAADDHHDRQDPPEHEPSHALAIDGQTSRIEPAIGSSWLFRNPLAPSTLPSYPE